MTPRFGVPGILALFCTLFGCEGASNPPPDWQRINAAGSPPAYTATFRGGLLFFYKNGSDAPIFVPTHTATPERP